jgi:hypothetical protein
MASTIRLVDIARLLGVSKQRAHQLASEGRLPAPLGRDARGRVVEPPGGPGMGSARVEGIPPVAVVKERDVFALPGVTASIVATPSLYVRTGERTFENDRAVILNMRSTAALDFLMRSADILVSV